MNGIYYINKRYIITSRKPLFHKFSSFGSPYSVLSFYPYLDKWISQIVNRVGSCMNSLSMYLRPVSYLILFTPCQPSI